MYFVAHAAAVDKRPGGLMDLCVMYTRRLVGLLSWPWFGRERTGNIGRFFVSWCMCFKFQTLPFEIVLRLRRLLGT